MAIYVYSTLTCDQKYTTWKPKPEGNLVPEVEHEVLIKGGANLLTNGLWTPRGVRTEISELDLVHLEQNLTFQKHVENKFIVVEKHRVDPERIVADKGMEQKDKSAPATPHDFENAAEGEAVPQKGKAA